MGISIFTIYIVVRSHIWASLCILPEGSTDWVLWSYATCPSQMMSALRLRPLLFIGIWCDRKDARRSSCGVSPRLESCWFEVYHQQVKERKNCFIRSCGPWGYWSDGLSPRVMSWAHPIERKQIFNLIVCASTHFSHFKNLNFSYN